MLNTLVLDVGKRMDVEKVASVATPTHRVTTPNVFFSVPRITILSVSFGKGR